MACDISPLCLTGSLTMALGDIRLLGGMRGRESQGVWDAGTHRSTWGGYLARPRWVGRVGPAQRCARPRGMERGSGGEWTRVWDCIPALASWDHRSLFNRLYRNTKYKEKNASVLAELSCKAPAIGPAFLSWFLFPSRPVGSASCSVSSALAQAERICRQRTALPAARRPCSRYPGSSPATLPPSQPRGAGSAAPAADEASPWASSDRTGQRVTERRFVFRLWESQSPAWLHPGKGEKPRWGLGLCTTLSAALGSV